MFSTENAGNLGIVDTGRGWAVFLACISSVKCLVVACKLGDYFSKVWRLLDLPQICIDSVELH